MDGKAFGFGGCAACGKSIGFAQAFKHSSKPDAGHVSTSHLERANLTLRMNNRRFTRLTNAFSKKLKNHEHHLALHFMYYNFVCIHQSLRGAPAMATGIADHVWALEEIVHLIDSAPDGS